MSSEFRLEVERILAKSRYTRAKDFRFAAASCRSAVCALPLVASASGYTIDENLG